MTPSEKEEVMAFQRKVERYWGIHLETKFSSEGGAPFSMRWGEVYLDEEELGRLDWDGRVREVGHELGHRAQEPGTAGGEVLWEAIATQEGVEQPADFCNVMSDMVIEHGNTVGHSLGVCPWAKPYSRGLRKTLAEHSEGRPPSVELLGEVDRMTLAEFRGKKVEAAPPALAERCYRLLFKAKLSKPEMIRRLAREAGHLFKDPMDYGESWNTGDGSEEREAGEAEPDRGKRGEGKPGRILIKPLSATGEATPSEEGEIASALVQLYGVEGITKETKELLRERAKRALRTLTAWQAYTNVVPIMKAFAGKHEKPLEVATSKWNVGMPIRKLDLKGTVSKYGMILPGITTLSRTEIKRTTTSSGLANLCLVFDGSGCNHPDNLVVMQDGTIVRCADIVKPFLESNPRWGKKRPRISSVAFRHPWTKKKPTVTTRPVSKLFAPMSPETLYRVTTTFGDALWTGEHRVFVRGFRRKLVEKEVKYLMVGDKLVVAAYTVNGSPQKLPQLYRGINMRDQTGKYTHGSDRAPIEAYDGWHTSPGLCQLLGYIIGDGHTAVDSKRSSGYVAITDESKECLEQYAKIVERTLFHGALVRRRGNRQRLWINFRPFAHWLRTNFPEAVCRSPNRTIPALFHRTTDSEVGALLRGLFDAEGTVGHHQIEFANSSKVLATQVRLLLLRLGVFTTWGERVIPQRTINGKTLKTTKFYRIMVSSSDDLATFQSKVGFSHPAKQHKLHNLVSRPKSPQSKSRRERKGALAFYPVTAVDAVKSEVDRVYDFEVHRTHNYLVNGFLSHNSMSGEKVERAIEATLGLIETARHFKDMFSLISIGGDFRKQSISDRLVFEPSYDYATPFNALLDFEGYGDCITNQMMNKAVEFAKRTDKQLTMVMSDNLWPDDFCKYSRQLEELLKHGPVIFVVFTKDEGWGNTLGAIAGKENATAVLVEDPTEPFTWAALEPAWKQLQKKEDSIFLSA